MNAFEYAAPKTLDEATGLLSNNWGETELLAGGTDLVTALKQQITQPKRVVSLRNIPELKGIKSAEGALRIGAGATLAEIAADSTVRKEFPSIVSAIEGIGSPQIISVGTIGGDLCQRPRCWYYRNGFGLFGKNGDESLVQKGDNRYHAIFGNNGQALYVHPSSLAPALIALGATVVATGPKGRNRKIEVAKFFQTPKIDTERETVLKPNEILTEVLIPLKGLKNATYEVRHRHGLDWPYVSASVAYAAKGGNASEARVVLGHVAPVPWVANNAGKAADGQKIDESVAGKAGEAAAQGAKPLSGNSYKVQLVKTAVKRALLAAAA